MALQIIIIQIITFAGLIFVLRILFYRQMNFALSRLKVLHEENLKKEAELKKELDIIKKQRDQELSQAREDAARIIREAKEKSERLSFDIQTQANSDSRQIIEQAKLKLQVFENELRSQYQQDTLKLAEQIFETVFTARGKEVLQHSLIVELIEEIRNLPADKFVVKSSETTVTSVYILNDEERRQIQSIISEKAGTNVTIKERIDPGIIAGLIIQIGPLTLDGSLRNKLNKTKAYLASKQY